MVADFLPDVAVLVVQDALTLVVKLVVWVVWGHVAAVAVVLARGLVVLSVREVAKVLLLPAAVVDVLPLVVGHQDPAHVLLAGRDVRIVAWQDVVLVEKVALPVVIIRAVRDAILSVHLIVLFINQHGTGRKPT